MAVEELSQIILSSCCMNLQVVVTVWWSVNGRLIGDGKEDWQDQGNVRGVSSVGGKVSHPFSRRQAPYRTRRAVRAPGLGAGRHENTPGTGCVQPPTNHVVRYDASLKKPFQCCSYAIYVFRRNHLKTYTLEERFHNLQTWTFHAHFSCIKFYIVCFKFKKFMFTYYLLMVILCICWLFMYYCCKANFQDAFSF